MRAWYSSVVDCRNRTRCHRYNDSETFMEESHATKVSTSVRAHSLLERAYTTACEKLVGCSACNRRLTNARVSRSRTQRFFISNGFTFGKCLACAARTVAHDRS